LGATVRSAVLGKTLIFLIDSSDLINVRGRIVQITAVNSAGRVVRFDANSASGLAAMQVNGVEPERVISIRDAGFWARLVSSLNRSSGSTTTTLEQLNFCDGLLQLLESGFTLTETLQIYQRQPHGINHNLSSAILTQMKAGYAPSEAFSRSGVGWSGLLIALLRAGESNGELASCLARYCQLERRSQALRQRMISASLYPACMLFFSSIVMLFLLGFVVPKFATLIDDPTRQLPWASRLVFGVSRTISDNSLWIFLSLVFIVAAMFAIWQSITFRRMFTQWSRQLPMVGRALDEVERGRINRVIAALVNGGLPLTIAIERAQIGVSEQGVKRLHIAGARIRQGERPSTSLFAAALITDIESELLASAERGGQLGAMLDRIAQIHEDAITRKADRLASLYSPALLFIVALVVGVVVIALYWPLLDVFEAVR
jgi:general secretion pathway protein F